MGFYSLPERKRSPASNRRTLCRLMTLVAQRLPIRSDPF
jgi:hypothetical protein